jgi:hypothetical protein
MWPARAGCLASSGADSIPASPAIHGRDFQERQQIPHAAACHALSMYALAEWIIETGCLVAVSRGTEG